MITTRFAPSPTGNFHIGSLRTAIYNYLFAKKNNGKFILRIEDTDKSRSKKEYVEEIIKVFEIFEIDYHLLNFQSNNINKHTNYLNMLIDKEFVYKSKEGPYKFRVNRDIENFTYNDEILGLISVPNQNIEDFSIARSDKSPTFILSNIIDDHLEEITNVIRGNDHSINTIKQKMLSETLSFKPINYAHIPLIHDISGKKLSKRDNLTNVLTYLELGYVKEALFNFIIKLGNSFNDIEYLNMEKSINNFELNKTVHSPAKFNLDKLNFYNNHYIQNLSYDQFYQCINNSLRQKIKEFNTHEIFSEILKRSSNSEDINNELEKLVKNTYNFNACSFSENDMTLLKDINNILKNTQTIDTFIEKLDKNDLSFKKTGKIFRKILVNFYSKLPIDLIIKFFGIKKVNDMISALIENE